jgi:hypothetical protein
LFPEIVPNPVIESWFELLTSHWEVVALNPAKTVAHVDIPKGPALISVGN